MAEKYDDVLVPFVHLMRRELHANSRKGDRPGWLAMDANTLLLEVYWHAAKLSAAVKNNDGPAIMEHSADVANMAMMVLDVCGGLAWVEVPDGARDKPPECGCGVDCQDRHDCRYGAAQAKHKPACPLGFAERCKQCADGSCDVDR